MGIKTLLRQVGKACHSSTILEFRNKAVAVDASCYIYRALYGGCPPEIYLRQLVRMLKRNGCKVYLVFDGKPPQEKAATLEARHKSSEQVLSCDLVNIVKSNLKNYGIEMVQAPFEADAQLAYLSLKGIVDVIITEDSDLIVFGCPLIIFKLRLNRNCIVYDKQKLHRCFEPSLYGKGNAFRDMPAKYFDFQKFRLACIIAGCDYVSWNTNSRKGYSFLGLGLKRAWKKLQTSELPQFLSKHEIEEIEQADYLFQYQIVLDLESRKFVTLSPI